MSLTQSGENAPGRRTMPGEGSKRARRSRETSAGSDSYVVFLRRILNGYGRRLAAGDAEDLKVALEIQDELEEQIRAGVLGMIDQGLTWDYIARELGVTRQAAWERWAPTSRKVRRRQARD